MRIGNAERDSVAAELREHYASGRLTLEELHERLDAALAAKTRGDLDALMTDLPSARPLPGGGADWNAGGPGAGPGRAGGWAGQAVAALAWTALAIFALMAVVFLGAFGIGMGKPLGIVLVVVALAFLRRLLFGRRLRGRGPRRRC